MATCQNKGRGENELPSFFAPRYRRGRRVAENAKPVSFFAPRSHREPGIGENGKLDLSKSNLPSPAARAGEGGDEGRAQHNQPLQRSSMTRSQRAQHAVPLQEPALGSCKVRHSRPGRSVFLPCPSFPLGKEGWGRMGALTFQNPFPLARLGQGDGGEGNRVERADTQVRLCGNRRHRAVQRPWRASLPSRRRR